MEYLERAGLVDTVKTAARSGRPFLGICVGMQILFDASEESPGTPGLGILPGRVVRFARDPDRKVPHMGWNTLDVRGASPYLAGIGTGAYVYFVHSYHAVPADAAIVATTTPYGVDFVSSVGAGNVFAGVFHPEKSQAVGLRLMANFVDLVRAQG
jgi:imidazole glycerol-phosphate synthase subunit HisH